MKRWMNCTLMDNRVRNYTKSYPSRFEKGKLNSGIKIEFLRK